jgi:sulfide:quinone oxidoreductase
VDGPRQIATFHVTDSEGQTQEVEEAFDYLHAVPPQVAPDFVKNSPLANEAGWLDVNPDTLQHTTYTNIFGCGDVISAPNAKTAAAIRKQAPVVARNIRQYLQHDRPDHLYDGYGSCPLTVERGKVVMAEFGYGGKLLPTIQGLDPTVPRSIWWAVKAKYLIPMYFDLMLKGRELLAVPQRAKTPNS